MRARRAGDEVRSHRRPQRAEKRDAFRYRVGRNRHGQLADVLDPTAEYDAWREMGACTKPDVEVLFMLADRRRRGRRRRSARLARDLLARLLAVGQRLYLRAVQPARVELAAGPPGGEPAKSATTWAIESQVGSRRKNLSSAVGATWRRERGLANVGWPLSGMCRSFPRVEAANQSATLRTR